MRGPFGVAPRLHPRTRWCGGTYPQEGTYRRNVRRTAHIEHEVSEGRTVAQLRRYGGVRGEVRKVRRQKAPVRDIDGTRLHRELEVDRRRETDDCHTRHLRRRPIVVRIRGELVPLVRQVGAESVRTTRHDYIRIELLCVEGFRFDRSRDRECEKRDEWRPLLSQCHFHAQSVDDLHALSCIVCPRGVLPGGVRGVSRNGPIFLSPNDVA